MQRVVTVNLAGNAYQLDQDAYETLQRYLDRASANLGDNPDRAEILADLERSIAEKCREYLRADKTVINLDEVKQILDAIGPVGDAPADSAERPGSEPPPAATPAQKRLYQIRDGALISGVCKGLSEYFCIDVSIVRIVFVLFALMTSGAWGIAYIVMMFVIPFAPNRHPAVESGIPAWTYKMVQGVKHSLGDRQTG